ncbi:hypothetical protein PPACK8108_LOCUS6381 [Phakopsora pachyrhizi]|uniref:Uncharacterized protein n=1 Tax=Phakopsora pachyrhizi TaxID=170000 RepID=A0AAV0AQY3_PHAPC|nr:hypothetical protein PPACK8108_LOCUS6381 [Phakopsora pachyrhizi]
MTDEMIKEEDSFVYLNLIKSLKDQSVDRGMASRKLENDNGNDVIEWVLFDDLINQEYKVLLKKMAVPEDSDQASANQIWQTSIRSQECFGPLSTRLAKDPRQRAVDTGCFEEIEKSLERIENKERVKEEKGFWSQLLNVQLHLTQAKYEEERDGYQPISSSSRSNKK